MLIKLENGNIIDTKHIAELQEKLQKNCIECNPSKQIVKLKDKVIELTDKLHRRNLQIADLKKKETSEKIWCEAGDCKSHGNCAGECDLQSTFNPERLGAFTKIINSTGHCNNYTKRV